MFVDRVTVHVRAGNGGAGVVSFEKVRGRPRGRPSGGNGGAGGDVILEADTSLSGLLTYQRNPHHSAGNGTHGQGELRHGRRGEDLVLAVPPGTAVTDEEGVMLADLVEPGQRVRVLEGGRGGRGNAAFVGPSHKAPAFAEQGEFGQAARVTMELKLAADAALIGFPNAGKSTLISVVSAAKPKVADYPFTTLEPHLGVVEVAGREFVMADIPGLIEGAADGKGLGHEFLRHVERARALVILLDPSPLQTEPPAEQLRILLDELGRHSPDLLDRPRVVAIGKADLGVGPGEWAAELGERVFVISAATGQGVEPLLHAVADAVDEGQRHSPEREGFILHRPVDEGFQVRRQAGTWVVEGRGARRAVAFDDLTRPATADLAARRLARLGVDRALRQAGAQPGDEVRIGELAFEYQASAVPPSSGGSAAGHSPSGGSDTEEEV